MDIIRLAIERPIAVLSAVIMIVVFGIAALAEIPIQLAPDVNKPIITVTTNWHGAAPAEVEREIVNRQEDALKGLEGLEKIESRSQDGRGELTLEFYNQTNMDRALLLVSNRLDQVQGMPDEADEPTIDTSSNTDRPIAWFILKRLPGNERPIHTFYDFAEDVIKEQLERVPGVAGGNVYGGSEREMQGTIDPERLAAYGLQVTDLVTRLRAANASISAGDISEGKRRYVVRTEGEFQRPADVAAVVLRTGRDVRTGRIGRVTVGDVAGVDFGYKEPVAYLRNKGEAALAINVVRETGANVIETMAGIKAALDELRAGPIPNAGLTLTQVYDETVYINSSIALVQQNIYVGGTLAALVLLLFLRSLRPTLVVTLAIPVSIVGSFVAMAALGRSINVISLAGMAFAVGMVVDAAIVVLENIFRLRQEGRSTAEAAYHGARQVWGAVLVSALTTVVVFAPILVMDLEVGQLFRDIAVAISVAVLLSLVVAVTVIPALAKRLLSGPPPSAETQLRLPVVDSLADRFVAAVMAFTRRTTASRAASVAVVAMVCGAAALATWTFLPKLDYLPEGNRNLAFGVMLPPPGYNLETTAEIATGIEDKLRPHWASETGSESASGESVKIDNFFFVVWRNQTFLGASAVDPTRASELVPVVRDAMFQEPGTFGFVNQLSLFGRGIGGGRLIEFNISGPDLQAVLDVALRATQLISGTVFPPTEGHQLRPNPGLELGAPEIRVIPDPVRLADSGVTATELGLTVDTYNDGLRVVEITVDGKRLDLTLLGPERNIRQTQGINNLPVVTESGAILPVSALAAIQVTAGPVEIRHLERARTVTLEIRPAPEVPLEFALERLDREVIQILKSEGLPPGVRLGWSGTADQLAETWDEMVVNLALAVIIVYLVMAVLFESFIYPLIIVLSVPLATAGGVGGLALLNIWVYQPLDMLTLLGFVILVGIVVNNAILLV
ncbi:MAG: efflux RND transporter permease subunit, partial [Rhodospirillaceae bacterium]|nr:efflux RND transporter permease subunit [Rhodospirillaceae bacterium]